MKQLFNRLYRISDQRDAKINEMGSWVDERWVWNFRWKMKLRERELLSILNRYELTQDRDDLWSWKQ